MDRVETVTKWLCATLPPEEGTSVARSIEVKSGECDELFPKGDQFELLPDCCLCTLAAVGLDPLLGNHKLWNDVFSAGMTCFW